MKVFLFDFQNEQALSEVYSFVNKANIALGNFDGVHIGHQYIMKHFQDETQKKGIVTFDPITRIYFDDTKKALMTFEEKVYFLEQLGYDFMIVLPFIAHLENMSFDTFISQYLKPFEFSEIHVGEDFAFGSKSRGKPHHLIRYLEHTKIEVFQRLRVNMIACSSTEIRSSLREGNIRKANMLQGHPYFCLSEVCKGDQIGRTLNFPTANSRIEPHKMLPKLGVYASRTYYDGKMYHSITNIGYRPSVKKEHELRFETHIFDFDKEIYGEHIRVELIEYIRAEESFETLEELKEMIKKDCEKANEILEDFDEIDTYL